MESHNDRDVREMKQAKGKYRLMEGLYIAIMVFLYALIVFTPYIFSSSTLLRHNVFIEAEFTEGVLIALLLIISYLFSVHYRRELDHYRGRLRELADKKTDAENKLNDAFRYIGAVNVQVQEIQSLFSSLKKYPQDKKDFKDSNRFLAGKVLSIVNADWVLLRIIDMDSLRTVHEHSDTRGKAVLLKHHISNKSIVSSEAVDGCRIVSSDPSNLTIKVFCVVPSEDLTATQRNFLKAIVNALEMIFIVFTSQYYRKNLFKQVSLSDQPPKVDPKCRYVM